MRDWRQQKSDISDSFCVKLAWGARFCNDLHRGGFIVIFKNLALTYKQRRTKTRGFKFSLVTFKLKLKIKSVKTQQKTAGTLVN